MKNIGGFFDKFKSKVAGEVQNRVAVIEAIKKHTGEELKMGDITLSVGVVRIKGGQGLKNEIFIKKSLILKDINSKTKALQISDIR